MLLYLLSNLTQQLRLASVRVVEAACLWQKDIKSQTRLRTNNKSSLDHHHLKGPARGKGEIKHKLESRAVATSRRVGEKTNTDGYAAAAAAHEGDIQGEIYEPKGDLSKRQPADRARASGVSAGKQADRGGDCSAAREMWVVTMMVPGIKLWGPSPAMGSKNKRFRRSREDLKIEKKQVRLIVGL